MIISKSFLFNNNQLSAALSGEIGNARKVVNEIPKEKFISNSDDQVIAHIYSKLEITPIKIYQDQIVRSEPQEITIPSKNAFGEHYMAAAVSLNISVPYTGESDLWKMQPSTYTHNPPMGDIKPLHDNDQTGVLFIRLEYYQSQFKGEIVNKEIEDNLSSIENYLATIEKDIAAHNQNLKVQISRLVTQRRERLNIIHETEKTIPIPLQKRPGVPDANPLPIHLKQIKPLATKVQQEPSYEVSEEDYQAILKIIRHEGATFERTPKTYSVHNEEELRDILLAHLNGHFEGQATGETFRKKGKTDITIEFENRAAFVAECKLWNGDKKVLEALDQLLGYLTWRDVKTSLIIFNKSVAGFMRIQEKVEELLRTHPSFLRVEATNGGTEWKLVLYSKEDQERYVTVQVYLFNLYVDNSS